MIGRGFRVRGPADDTTFHFQGMPQEIVSGMDTISGLGAALDARGIQRALVVCGPRILAESDVVQRVERALGRRLVGRFDGVAPHSPVEAVQAAKNMAARLSTDALVSVGGGSTVTVVKGVALLLSTDRDLLDFEVHFEPPDRVIEPTEPLPDVSTRVIAVPTTIGCGEVGPSGGGFAHPGRGRKVIIHGRGRTSPELVVIDGRALATTPDEIQRATAMGQLRVGIESYTSVRHNPIGDALALHGVRLLSQEFSTGWHNEPAMLLRVKAAANLTTLAMVSIGTLGLNSAIAHQIGAIFDVPHGEANAIMLPRTVGFNATALPKERAQTLLAALGDEGGVGTVDYSQHSTARLTSLRRALNLPERLRDVGVPESGLDDIATATMGDRSLATNAREVSRSEVLTLLADAW